MIFLRHFNWSYILFLYAKRHDPLGGISRYIKAYIIIIIKTQISKDNKQFWHEHDIGTRLSDRNKTGTR